jgi:hypothetical protein
MLEIGDLALDKFRGIFKLTYSGDAYIVLQTNVQANPVSQRRSGFSLDSGYSDIVAADTPLVLPMRLRISNLKLRGIIVLVIDSEKGVTLVFKNDPLESVLVSSTFDGFPSVERFLQAEIEKQLKSLFQEDLPALVHNMSMRQVEERKRQHEMGRRRRASQSSSGKKMTTAVSSPVLAPSLVSNVQSLRRENLDVHQQQVHRYPRSNGSAPYHDDPEHAFMMDAPPRFNYVKNWLTREEGLRELLPPLSETKSVAGTESSRNQPASFCLEPMDSVSVTKVPTSPVSRVVHSQMVLMRSESADYAREGSKHTQAASGLQRGESLSSASSAASAPVLDDHHQTFPPAGLMRTSSDYFSIPKHRPSPSSSRIRRGGWISRPQSRGHHHHSDADWSLTTSPQYEGTDDEVASVDLDDLEPMIVHSPPESIIQRLTTLKNDSLTISPYTRRVEHFTTRTMPHKQVSSHVVESTAPRRRIVGRLDLRKWTL